MTMSPHKPMLYCAKDASLPGAACRQRRFKIVSHVICIALHQRCPTKAAEGPRAEVRRRHMKS